MQHLDAGEPEWELVFDEQGRMPTLSSEVFISELLESKVEDLFVFSHGWNTNPDQARELYDTMFPLISEATQGLDTLGRVGFVGVIWPSIWFPETEAHVERTFSSEQDNEGERGQYDDTSGSQSISGSDIAKCVVPGFAESSERASIAEICRLIDHGIASTSATAVQELTDIEQEQLIIRIHALARSLAPRPSGLALEDAGELSLFSAGVDAKQAYQGVAETFGLTSLPESLQGAGDWFRNAIEGAKDMLRILSYTIMKARAGTVGGAGLGPLLAALKIRGPEVRVHLIGHSFGARLVSFALSGIPEPEHSPVSSLLLLQGAFSHFSFSRAEQNPFGSPGALHNYANRVNGPLVATYSVFDYAVGRWYPKASFLSRQDAEEESVGRWDGMGADGFQAVTPLERLAMPAAGGTDYTFQPQTFYRVDAYWVINDDSQSAFSGAHSDIRKAAVAQLAAAAAAAHA